MRNVWAIARITFLEGLRSRVFFGLFLVSLLLFSTGYMVTSLFPRDVIKVATDLSLGVTSLVGLILTMFLGTQLLAKDFEKRTIHMVLAKAVSRSEYVGGKFAGFCSIIVCSMILLGGVATLATWVVDWLTSDQYGVIHLRLFFLSLSTMTLMFILLTSVIFFFSSFTSSTFLALGLTVVVYLIGQSIEEVKHLLAAGVEGGVSPIFAPLIAVASYVFPNLAAFDFKTQAAHGLVVPISTVVWTFFYGLSYTGVTITCAAWIFRRREFP